MVEGQAGHVALAEPVEPFEPAGLAELVVPVALAVVVAVWAGQEGELELWKVAALAVVEPLKYRPVFVEVRAEAEEPTDQRSEAEQARASPEGLGPVGAEAAGVAAGAVAGY